MNIYLQYQIITTATITTTSDENNNNDNAIPLCVAVCCSVCCSTSVVFCCAPLGPPRRTLSQPEPAATTNFWTRIRLPLLLQLLLQPITMQTGRVSSRCSTASCSLSSACICSSVSFASSLGHNDSLHQNDFFERIKSYTRITCLGVFLLHQKDILEFTGCIKKTFEYVCYTTCIHHNDLFKCVLYALE